MVVVAASGGHRRQQTRLESILQLFRCKLHCAGVPSCCGMLSRLAATTVVHIGSLDKPGYDAHFKLVSFAARCDKQPLMQPPLYNMLQYNMAAFTADQHVALHLMCVSRLQVGQAVCWAHMVLLAQLRQCCCVPAAQCIWVSSTPLQCHICCMYAAHDKQRLQTSCCSTAGGNSSRGAAQGGL